MTGQLTCTVAEVVAALGMAESTIYERVRRGEIPNVGVGRAVRIPRPWLDGRLAEVGVSIAERSKSEVLGEARARYRAALDALADS